MSQHKQITIPLLFVIAGCVIPNLFPAWDAIGKIIPYARDYNWVLPVIKASVGVITLLAPYATYHRFVYKNESYNKLIDKLKSLQTQVVDSSSYLRHNELILWTDNIKEIIQFDLSLYNKFERNISRVDSLFRLGMDNSREIKMLYSILNQSILVLENRSHDVGRTRRLQTDAQKATRR